MMSTNPSTNFHIQNEKVPENEDEPSKRLNQKFIIFPGYYFPIKPPPKQTPFEKNPSCISKICSFLFTILIGIIYLLCLPIFIILYIIFGVIPRILVSLLLCCCGGGYKLLPISHGFGSTINNGNHHMVMLIVRGVCDFDRLRTHMLITLDSDKTNLKKHISKRFGFLCLKDCSSDFDIENHVKYFDTLKKNEEMEMGLDEVISFLEADNNNEDPFKNIKTTVPQWKLDVIPKFVYSKEQAELLDSTDTKQFYCLIFRFNQGIMDWNMFQDFLSDFFDKTRVSLGSTTSTVPLGPTFSPPLNLSCCTKLKILLAFPFVGPKAFLGQLCRKWKNLFAGLELQSPRTSLGISKTFDVQAFEDVKSMSFTSLNSVLYMCVRSAIRNLIYRLNLELPKSLRLTRVFNINSSALQRVDSISINFSKFQNPIQRLHSTFHALKRQQYSLAAQRLFNKTIMLVAGTFPYYLSAWFYKKMLKGDVIVEIWPAADAPCTLFGTDVIADIVGWSGISGVHANMKATVTTYCWRVRVNFTGKHGFIGSLTDAQVLSNEFGEEFKTVAEMAGLYEKHLYLSPAVDTSNLK